VPSSAARAGWLDLLVVVVERDFLIDHVVAQRGHRLVADGAAADESFVIGFDGEHRYQRDGALVVGEDADDGAAGDLAVEALKRIRRAL
jgi:hypothetical protein